MKNRPLGFQIWGIVTLFMACMTVVVVTTTIVTINRSSPIKVDLLDGVLVGNLIRLIICIIIVSVIISKVIANTISEPIRYLERKVRLISNKKWVRDFKLDRRDEIGRLAYSIGKMQNNLERLDKEEEFFLQSLSHELKTPIMVLNNYCQALRDEIYINNSYEDTIDVIEEEINALGKKIEKLLYISSLEYILEKESDLKTIDLGPMVAGLSNRICAPVEGIEVTMNLERMSVLGIEEKLQVAIENILENCVRYARSRVSIDVCAGGQGDLVLIEIKNDGDAIPTPVMEHLFDKFYKGLNGNFGLGLFITKKIIEFHKGHVLVENRTNEVVFTIQLPCDARFRDAQSV